MPMPAAPRPPAIGPLPRALVLLALGAVLLSQNACAYFAGAATIGAGIGVATTPRRVVEFDGKYRPDVALQVSFDAPREVAALASGGDSLRVSGATRLVGRVREVRGDTVVMAIAELRRVSGGAMGFASRREPIVRLVPDQMMQVNVYSARVNPAVRGAIGAALGSLLAFIGLVGFCYVERCID